MPRLPVLKAEQVISTVEKVSFQVVRQRGSQVRLRHEDGGIVTVPVHSGQDVGRGLLREILRDADLTTEDLLRL